jgi:hypothetical protein
MDLERVDDLNVKGLIHALHQAYYKRAQKGKRTVIDIIGNSVFYWT